MAKKVLQNKQLANLTSNLASVQIVDLQLTETRRPISVSVDWLYDKMFLVVEAGTAAGKVFNVVSCNLGNVPFTRRDLTVRIMCDFVLSNWW
jgi:hypothetical protein